MSFLTRIAQRSAGARSAIRPKGLGRPAAPRAGVPAAARPLRRQEEKELQTLRRQEEEEELAQPVRRQEEEEEALQTVRRQGEAAEEQEEAAQPLRRQQEEELASPARRQEKEDELAQPLRRQEEEEEELVQPMRRQEEEALQTLRRQEEQEEEELQTSRTREEEEPPLQTIRRRGKDAALRLRRQTEEEEEAAQPLRRKETTPEHLEPENATPPDELASEPELPDARALRREAETPAVSAGPVDVTTPHAPIFDSGPATQPFEARSQAFERPSVRIDQIDVLIHEPVSPARRAAGNHRRRVRARYLRRL